MLQLEIHTLTERRTLGQAELARLAAGGRIRVRDLLDAEPGATHATFESVTCDYRASVPLDIARDQGWVVVDGAGLRLRVEEGATLCWNVKDLERVRLTTAKEPDSVPENPPH